MQTQEFSMNQSLGNQNPASQTPEKIVRSETEWRAQLTPEQYQILREKATERPHRKP
jgi:peptide-methionine (R)-S-oxide reductase